MALARASLVGVGLICVEPVAAHPDGAPWGSADPAATENCASCHFDQAAIKNAGAISLEGLPAEPTPRRAYDLMLRFTPFEEGVAGFLLSTSAGFFVTTAGGLEAQGREVRSNQAMPLTGAIEWRVTWVSPQEDTLAIFHAAVNAANNDASPFGDQVYFQRFELGQEH